MRHMVRRIGIAAATAAILVGVAGTGARAAGAVNPYTAEGLCGLGFRTVDQDPIHDGATGIRLGTVYLLHNPFTGYGCAVTLKSTYVGVPTRTQVYLDPEWTPLALDDGDRRYAAGPIYAFVQGGCVIWGGLMEDSAGVHLHDRANPAIGGAVTCF
ncbi:MULTISPECIES: spore-associated protein A [Micromonospora]|uniref:Spore-associated protein A n=1 Tax=Micromonospora solifontis TaxID=2487138 RepID=A0ABX9WAF4_9ACTN|nr:MULTISPECIES: spore-associated protein A [Micromonospora]NES16864.1 spore-associated protein A [Micromonospora sp. PPF5-17B]NES39199.1 spore-associated protein A [Micromonospora solifontis]NES58938.1 spore-associated protein A [Micromonospora sp. PPF5-6]RNL90346.1 spore-associated protein A [Micromonospora solifontis]